MKLRIAICKQQEFEGLRAPRGYALAYIDYERWLGVYYPIGLHKLVGWWQWAWDGLNCAVHPSAYNAAMQMVVSLTRNLQALHEELESSEQRRKEAEQLCRFLFSFQPGLDQSKVAALAERQIEYDNGGSQSYD